MKLSRTVRCQEILPRPELVQVVPGIAMACFLYPPLQRGFTIVLRYALSRSVEHRMINPVVDPVPPTNHRVTTTVLSNHDAPALTAF